jgi:hypothetical protein
MLSDTRGKLRAWMRPRIVEAWMVRFPAGSAASSLPAIAKPSGLSMDCAAAASTMLSTRVALVVSVIRIGPRMLRTMETSTPVV